MSVHDLFEDGFPHGTPAGYTDGCKSGACPAKAEFGMSCRMAWQAEKSDRRYRRLVDEGLTPAAIAVELGFVEPEQLSTAAAVELAAERVKSTGVSTEQMLDAARTVFLADSTDAATVTRDLSRPARIRAWARDQGLTVGSQGPIRRAVIEAFDAAHPALTVEPEETALAEGTITITGAVALDEPVPEHTELARTEEILEASRIENRALINMLDEEMRFAASAHAEAAALRRALADRARRGRGVVAWFRRVVSR